MLKSLFPWKHHKTKAVAAQQTMDDEVPEDNLPNLELHPCHVCGRTFLPVPLKKHVRVCEKTASKKRKPFDSLKQRVEGTDLADFHQKTYLKKPEPAPAPDPRKHKQNWKEKHLALVSAIRAAKGVPTEMSNSSPKTKSTTALMAGTERCPSCDRQFGPKAYDRHVEWCKEKKAQQRIHHSPANVLLAKERLEARTKYVPPLNRSRKTVVREKYSNHTSTETLTSVKGGSPLSRGPSVRKPRSVVDIRKTNDSTSNNDERKERPKLEKCVNGGGDKVKVHEHLMEKHTPVIASQSPKAETGKSFQKKRNLGALPFSKINKVAINNQIGGLTVSSLKYDNKKMVTWKDTVKTVPESKIDSNADSGSKIKLIKKKCVKKKKSNTVETPDCSCASSSPSVKVQPQESDQESNCEKNLSSNDALHKEPIIKIPLSKYSFKKKINLEKPSRKFDHNIESSTDIATESAESNISLTLKSSNTDTEETVLETQKSSSCNSVAEAFQKLKIDSVHEIKCDNDLEEVPKLENIEDTNHHTLDRKTIPEADNVQLSKEVCANVEKIVVDHSIIISGQRIETNKDYGIQEHLPSKPNHVFNYSKNSHKDFTNWFEDYMTNAEKDSDGTTYVVEDKETEHNIEEHSKEIKDASKHTAENPACNDNLVFLFKSATNLDLTREASDFTLTDKKTTISEENFEREGSEETIDTNCELDSIELEYNKASCFSLRKSLSDIGITSIPSVGVLSSKHTLISLYSNKNKDNFDAESIADRRLSNSLPNVQLCEFSLKVGKPQHYGDTKEESNQQQRFVDNEINKENVFSKEKETLRRKILEIAAEKFIEDCHTEINHDFEEEINLKDSSLNFLNEEYTVPKKRRKIDNNNKKLNTFTERQIFPLFTLDNFDLQKFKALTITESKTDKRKESTTLEENGNEDCIKEKETVNAKLEESSDLINNSSNLGTERSDVTENRNENNTNCRRRIASALSMSSVDYSPRIFTILDRVLNHRNSSAEDPEDSRNLLVVTPSDCRKLIELDRCKLPQIERHLKKIKSRYKRKSSSPLKLPSIQNKVVFKEDKETQVVLSSDEPIHLPKISEKFVRRENLQKVNMDIKKDINDVYLEYDSKRDSFDYDPFESAQRQFMELLECDEFKSLTPTCTPVKHAPRPHTTSNITPNKQSSPTTKKKTIKSAEPKITTVAEKNNRASVIEPPSTFKDSLDSVSDDFELMENLINDNFTDDNKNNTGFYLHLKPEKESLTLSDILNSRKYSDDMSSIDPRLINETDNLSIPEHFHIDDYSPTSTTDTDITIQNEVDHYSVQYDKKIAAIEPKAEVKSCDKMTPSKLTNEKKPLVKRSISLVNRAKTNDNLLKVTNKKLTPKSKLTSKSVSSVTTGKCPNNDKKKGLSTLKRSITSFDPAPKPPSLKNKNDVNTYFSEQNHKISTHIERHSPEKEVNESEETLKPEDLFTVDDEMYEEYKRYEEMYLKEKAQNCVTKKHKPKIIDMNFGIHTASEEEDHSSPFNNKISNDSAYGSLTRKAPKHRSRPTKLTPLEQKQVDSTSSSGSENCPNSPAINQRLSKFCHECGNKYPLTTAKFCVECGVKRLVL